ncbi:chemotaxis protein CheY [Synechococcus sp. WH 8020]|uniref:DUF3685 domain-containing protein n=1 Tax=Synechococcus sp. (strain WH8020) TaxID=32052 RepID=UPI00065267E4|nr:DUF3685 domain-containing protein [Synechococcus sp. WH 8020]AKN62205.1 chemotaxis protein CheY [Synechococcus sp. WH 8020]
MNGIPNKILLIARNLLAESLLSGLAGNKEIVVSVSTDQLDGQPDLVIWSIETVASPALLQLEVIKLQSRWGSAPLLLLLPATLPCDPTDLLSLDCAGLLQDPDLTQLQQSIETLLSGGRVVELTTHPSSESFEPVQSPGLGSWLLMTGLQQINHDLRLIEVLLNPPPENPMLRFMLEGRCRELRSARQLLLWLWGPLQLGLEASVPLQQSSPFREPPGTSIQLKERNGAAVWNAIHQRLETAVTGGLSNATGQMLAIEGLQPERRRELLLALLDQLNAVLQRLRLDQQACVEKRSDQALSEHWQALQPELRQQALCTMAGHYVRLPMGEELSGVADHLLLNTELEDMDEELPNPKRMLAPFLDNQPVLVDGQLLPADDPRALLQLETLVSNWLVRTAELIGSELLGVCGDWPELRRYLLEQRLISTRELERLRNQLNTQSRWQTWIQRPIRLYESQRLLYQLNNGTIAPLLLTEPRDEELRRLGWWQQQVALLLEARDALAPQVQLLVRRVGDLLAVVLTQVIGRAIGLVGRGIAQGMGRSFNRS